MCLSSSLSLTFVFVFIFVIDFCLLSLTFRGHKHWISRLCQLWKQFPRVPTVETIVCVYAMSFLKFNVFVFIFVIDFCLCHCLGHKTLKKWCWESVSERRLADLIDVTLVSEDESCLLVKIVNWRRLSIDEGWTSLRSDSLWWFACGDVISTVRYSILHQLKIKWIKWIKWILH